MSPGTLLTDYNLNLDQSSFGSFLFAQDRSVKPPMLAKSKLVLHELNKRERPVRFKLECVCSRFLARFSAFKLSRSESGSVEKRP